MAGKRQTLLTGFGPFANVVDNPTARIVAHFQTEQVDGHALSVHVFPVSFARAAKEMRSLLEAGSTEGRPFDTILMLGVNRKADTWHVERQGRNWDEVKEADCDGVTAPGCVIRPDLADLLPATLPNEALVEALQEAGIPCALSDSAGSNLCNHLLFTTLAYLQEKAPAVRAGFLHVPGDAQTFASEVEMRAAHPFERHLEAVRVALRALQ